MRIAEKVIDNTNNTKITNNIYGTRTIGFNKVKLIETIQNNFNDELIGKFTERDITIQILKPNKIKKEIINKKTDFTIENKCTNCNICCIPRLPISNREIEVIKLYIKENNIKENTEKSKCPFLKNNLCSIYEVRPEVCKDFMCNKENKVIQEKIYTTRELFFK